MDPNPNIEKDLFAEALELPLDQREGFLKGACRGDEKLRRSVEALLRVNGDATCILATEAGLPAMLDPQAAWESPGTIIGRYKLLQQIGHGGCGVVYMAEQEEPVRRRVALKVIKLGMDTKSVIARFEAERQALAMMDHPNIARVLDAGATDAGRPYFVMELVRGVKITEYCDQHSLSTPDRLNLFVKVCQAIQHAHQKGIIHRDIKPSNVLVTLHDGVAVPKVIDFGIAKATTGQHLTDKTLFTALEQFIGTPAYMSPEQAEMSGLDIDTRADIYSLGVLLYELLVGQTPFDAKEMMQGGLDALRRIIREREPVRPSTKLNTLQGDARTSAGKRRQTDVGKLVHQLEGDLDWIVMKCLEKDRTRRYETANGLAADIQRHLASEPVLACPPSTAYRFQKLVRRNKLAFAAITCIAAVLVLGVVVSTWQTIRATQARASSDKNAEKARQAEQKAESTAAAITRNLYFAEMNLAGQAAAEAGGIGWIAALTAKWLPEKGAADLRGWEWYYLRSLLHQDLFTLSGHTNGVNSVAWHPDGKRLATGGSDHTVKIWDAGSREVTLILTGHANSVSSVAWSPDGKLLASASEDNTLKLWDASTGHQKLTLLGHTQGVLSVAWSPDGKRLASGSDDNMIKVWDAHSGTNILTLDGHGDGVFLVSWSPDGKRLASGKNKTVKVWDVDSGTNIFTLQGHSYRVTSTSWSPDGKRLASGSWDNTVKVWDAHSGTNILNLGGHRGIVFFVAWSPDGKLLASASADGTVKIWDAASGTNTFTHRGHTKDVNSVSWSPDGRRLASASGDNSVKVWDVDSEEIPTLRGHTDAVNSVAWSPDGKRLASSSVDETVKLWDLTGGGQEPRTLPGHVGHVWLVAWNSEGDRLASAGFDNVVKVWDVARQQLVTNLIGHTNQIVTVAWSPDGRRLASGSADTTVKVWDAASGRAIHTLRGHSNMINQVAWSHDGKLLASGCGDGTVKVWDPDSEQVIHTLREHTGWVTSVAWSPDGKRLASGSLDNTANIWDAASWHLLKTLRGHTGGILPVSWSPDGKRLASGSWDHTIKIWDAASGLETLTLRGHISGVMCVAWSPDGKRLVSGSVDKTIKLWDARKGHALETE